MSSYPPLASTSSAVCAAWCGVSSHRSLCHSLMHGTPSLDSTPFVAYCTSPIRRLILCHILKNPGSTIEYCNSVCIYRTQHIWWQLKH